MSYDGVWGVTFKELQKAGFRPLTNDAWSGVKTRAELEELTGRAAKLGLTVIIPIKRWEVKGRFNYTCDLSMLHGSNLGFRWTFVPFSDLTPNEKTTPPWANGAVVDAERVFGYAFFQSEADAVAWKLLVI